MIAGTCGSTGGPDHGTFCEDYYPCLYGECIDDYYSFWCNCSEGYVGQFCECKFPFSHSAVNLGGFHHPDVQLFRNNSTFALSETETETVTENKYPEANGFLCCPLSLCSVNFSTQSFRTHFISVSVSVSVSSSVNTLLV